MNISRPVGSRLGATLFLGALLASSSAAAQHFTALYSFTGPRNGDGAYPLAGVIADNTGALYGTTPSGGAYGFGTVFELAPPQNGKTHWTETVLYSFKGGNDAAAPEGGLVLDANGALYGTTAFGGGARRCLGGGCGTIFKLSPPAEGRTQWTETLLHRFADEGDGAVPAAGLIFGSAGALFGTTSAGGSNDGATPQASLVADKTGALYGTTYQGGTHDTGTVFRLVPDGYGGWTEGLLHSFTGGASGANRDGGYPIGGVTFDASGALYGTTFNAGRRAQGAVFKLTPSAGAGAPWTETVIYSFTGNNGDGSGPAAGLSADSTGALFGTTEFGGGANPQNFGTIFRLTYSGRWTEDTVHVFAGPTDGALPYAALIAGPNGAFYGTTQFGGAHNAGTVFEVTP